MDLNSESESEDELPTPTPSSQPAEVPSEAEPAQAMAPAMQATQAATQGSAEPGPAEAAEPAAEAPTRWPLAAPTSETVRHKGAGARKSEWAACDRCNKWRRLPRSVAASSLPDPWYCEMNTWDEQRNRCEVAEERLRYGDGNEQDDLSVIPTVAPDGTQLVMSADSATGYKGVALSAGGKRSRDEAAALSDTAPYRVEYSMDKDGKLAPKGAGVRKTRYFASCLEAATWHAARPHARCSTRACPRARSALLTPHTPPPRLIAGTPRRCTRCGCRRRRRGRRGASCSAWRASPPSRASSHARSPTARWSTRWSRRTATGAPPRPLTRPPRCSPLRRLAPSRVGRSYERTALKELMRRAGEGEEEVLSPLTREPLQPHFFPNVALRQRIESHADDELRVAEAALAAGVEKGRAEGEAAGREAERKRQAEAGASAAEGSAPKRARRGR